MNRSVPGRGLFVVVSLLLASCVPERPESVVALPNDGAITLTWPAVDLATSYKVYWNTTGSPDSGDSSVTVSSLPWTHTGRTNGTRYYYAVEAQGSSGTSDLSRVVSAVPRNDYASNLLQVQFPLLTAEASGCSMSDPSSDACTLAVHQLCGDLNYQSGFGPVETFGATPDGPVNWAQVVCTQGGELKTLAYSTLNAELSGSGWTCGSGSPTGIGCRVAAHRYCRDEVAGQATGYGPVTYTGSDATIVCMPAGSISLKTSIPLNSSLAARYTTCSSSNPISDGCQYAYSRYCRDRNFLAGVGPVENAGSNANVMCVQNLEGATVSETSPMAALWNASGSNLGTPSDLNILPSSNCNVASFGSEPSMGLFMLGKEKNKENAGCTLDHSSLTANVFSISGSSPTIEKRNLALSIADGEEFAILPNPPVLLDPAMADYDYVLDQVLDPKLIEYNGQLWAAFECLGANFSKENHGDNSVCMAVLDERTQTIKQETIRLVISGRVVGDEHKAAASPTLMKTVSGGVPTVYLYWTLVKSEPHGTFQELHAKGVKLKWVSDHFEPIVDTSGGTAQSIYTDKGPVSGALDVVWTYGYGKTADIFEVAWDESDGSYYAFSGVGQTTGCMKPDSNVGPHCYHLYIGKASSPLGDFTANGIRELVHQGHNYSWIYRLPDGTPTLIGNFRAPQAQMKMYPIDIP